MRRTIGVALLAGACAAWMACGTEGSKTGADNGTVEDPGPVEDPGSVEDPGGDPGKDAGTDVPATCEDGCPDDGARECSGNGVRVCSDNNDDGCLEWSDVQPCGPGAQCVAGSCVAACADQPCTVAGARTCQDGTTTASCGDYNGDGCLEWGEAKACDSGLVCSNGFCATSCTDACTTLQAKKCDAGAVVTCADHDSNGCLEWGAPESCGAQACVNGHCQAQCQDECTRDGARKCDGNGWTQCGDPDGDGCLGWGTVQPCAPDQTCSNGACATQCSSTCTVSGARRCEGDAVATCGDANGDGCLEWGTAVPCQAGQSCNAGVCEAQCKAECSVLGASRCDEAGNRQECVDSDGKGCLKWGTPAACEPPLVCSLGSCSLACSDECPSAGDRQCAQGTADQFQVCGDSDGDGCLEWGTAQPCDGGLVCSGAACVAACSDQCPGDGLKGCEGNATHACGDFNGDGCLEWGTLTYCKNFEQCTDGACVEKAAPGKVVVNEVLFDSAGSPDLDSFIEILGPAGLDLSGFRIVGVNGADGKDYVTISLDGAKLGDDGFFVVAHPSAAAAIRNAADLLDTKADLQNAPDSVQVRFGTKVVDALAYGTFGTGDIAAGEGKPEPKTKLAGHSLGRDAAGTDTDDNATDFSEFVTPTPGAPNVRPNAAPVASLLCPPSGQVGEMVTFDGSGSTDSDGLIGQWSFDFGDGGNQSGNQPFVSYAFTEPGTYQVTLTVTDDGGATGQATCGIPISSPANKPPTAVLFCPAEPKAGAEGVFDGSSSSDPDGVIVTYAFDFGDTGTAAGAATTASHAYAQPGDYTVTLTVTDDSGATAQATCTVTVAPTAAPDRTISVDTELCGTQVFGKLTIQGGATVRCSTGVLDVVADEVSIDPASKIDLSGTSSDASGGDYRTCSAACVCDYAWVGGGGGGNATAGATSASTMGSARSPEMGGCLGSCVGYGCSGASGGPAQGTSTELDAPKGGAGGLGCESVYSNCYKVGLGGLGGGSVRIVASKSISVLGSILANGQAGVGYLSGAGGGGGAGGTIVLAAPSLAVSGTVSAIAGAGGEGSRPGSPWNSAKASGGNGAPGRVKLCHGATYSVTGTVQPEAIASVLPPVRISSSTHPDPALAYNDTFASFDAAWEAPFAGAQGYWYALSNQAGFVVTPANGTYTADRAVSFPASAFTGAGTWTLRLITVDASAINGTVAGKFTVQVNGTPHAVASSSHPDPAQWYAGKAIALSWTPPAGTTAASFPAYWYRLDRVSVGDASKAKAEWTRTTNTGVVLTADASGAPIDAFAYHFHLVAEDTRGNLTKAAASFRIQVGAEPARTNVFGYVKDGGGAAIQGATVRLEPYGLEVTTDANGYFLVSQAYEGAYTLTARKAGYADVVQAVTVNAASMPLAVTMAGP